MSTTLPNVDQILEPFAACLTPEVAQRIADVKVDDPTMIERLECLRNKANDGNLSAQERIEYEEFVEANDLLMLLRETARSVLRQHG
jgi:hypothetical protein